MAKGKLPKSWTTVTPFSRYLAMALFVVLPFVAFYFGIQYQLMVTPSYPPTQYVPIPRPKLPPFEKQIVSNNQTCGANLQTACASGFDCLIDKTKSVTTGVCVRHQIVEHNGQ